ncbi:hypothetical protein GCM10023221_27020 [Luteimicrobium xylanilyticum]|uniref:Peptidoglycan binding-like domain-containing protein n=1 Tax=Luteimicrobium xylanilyticum TaxID=1133546 RepID=A0A5P9QEZ0_9MICO|nr:hypothetical protein KDY119_03362 [Luteimicrobium xylanilyticum]
MHRPGRARGRWLAIWATITIAICAAAFVVGGRVRSPWDAAIASADTSPVVTAKVAEHTVRNSDDLLTGTVSLGNTEALTVPSPDGVAVVTKINVGRGDVLRPGQVVGEVSGTSVVALALPFPLYRDLAPGDTGSDVKAVQDELVTLGLMSSAAADGTYGGGTAVAVAKLFSSGGGAPPPASGDARAALATARQALADAKDDEGETASAVASASKAVATAEAAAGTPLPRSAVVLVPAHGAEVVAVAKVGDSLAGGDDLLSVRSGSATVTVRAAVDQVPKVGAAVRVASVVDTSVSVDGVVSHVGQFTAGKDAQGPGNDVVVKLSSVHGLADGDSVTVTPRSGAPTSKGLAVPLTSLRDAADGSSYVLRVTNPPTGGKGHPTTERVTVELGASGNGYALVDGGSLRSGDVVVVSEP